MAEEKTLFDQIVAEMTSLYEHVEPGKMMSSPAITFKGKVFAFFYKDQMCFRLGRDFDMLQAGVSEFTLLNPFKNKPPMKDWFIVTASNCEHWNHLAKKALGFMQLK